MDNKTTGQETERTELDDTEWIRGELGDGSDNFKVRPSKIASLGFSDFANDPATTVGLDYGFKAGHGRSFSGSVEFVAAGTITLADNADNWVYYDPNAEDVETSAVEAPFGSFVMARVTTVSGAITVITDRRAFANAFGSYSSQQLLNDIKVEQDTAALQIKWNGGVIQTPAGVVFVSGNDEQTVADNTTTYFEVDVAGTVSSNTAGYTAGRAALATVITLAGVITSIESIRGFLFVPGPAVTQVKVTTAQFDKTNDDALANIPGLSVDVEAGATYTFEALLFTQANIATGVYVALFGTVTPTSIIYKIIISNDNNGAIVLGERKTAIGGTSGNVGANFQLASINITGSIEVDVAGTLTVQFAELMAVAATTSSVLVGSKFTVTKVP